MSVKFVRLGSLCKFLNGGTPSKQIPEYYSGPIPWITGTDISDGKISVARSHITERAIRESATNLIKKGTLLLVTRTSVGKTALAYDDLCFSQDITAILPEETLLDKGYLLWFIQDRQNYFKSVQRGATIQGITRDVLASLEIPLPPLTEQKRIAAILDEADKLHRKRREAIAKLDMLLQSVFLEMFGDPVTNPEGWHIRLLGDLLENPAQNGAYYPPEQYSTKPSEGVEMVHMGDAFYGIVKRGNLKRVYASEKETQKYSLSHNDLLIARRSLVYEGSAKPCLIPKVENEPLIFESSLIKVTPKTSIISPLYLYHFLSNQRAKTRYVLPYVTRSTISGINQSNLIKISLPLPPFRLQEEFASRVTEINSMRKQHEVSLHRLETLFATLQYQAFAPSSLGTTAEKMPT